MPTRPLPMLIATFLVAAAGLTMPGFSSATYTSATRNTATVSAAPDWTPPSVVVQNPGSPLKSTVTLTATATDGETGVQSVALQYLPLNGSSWTTVCTTATAPYSCPWITTDVIDGTYDLRARATDNAGYTSTSDPVRTTVANSLLVVLTSPGDVVRGTVPLVTTLYNAGSLSYTVDVEYWAAGANSWKPICTGLASPYSCSWPTTSLANDDYVDLRAVAYSSKSTPHYYSAVVPDVLIDNTAPSATMTDPGTPLSGTRTFTATASDTHSGVAHVVLQYAASGTTTYRDLCTVTAPPYSCRFDTAALADGSYGFRAVATDVAGNVGVSAVVGNRVVDNTISSVSMEDPGPYLTGTVTLTATASSSAGVGSVRIQRAPTGTGSWTDVCTDSTAPYSCAWNTTSVAEGLYDLRAVMVDGSGRTTTSSTVSARRVDNSPLRGADVQAANGGALAGKLENGDSITFTYSDQVDLTTVTPGWNGGSLQVSVRVRDGNLLSLGNKGDTLDVLRSGSAVNLGSVNLKDDYIKSNKSTTFDATMTAGTTTLNGVTCTTVTIRLGAALTGSGAVRTATTGSAMVWTPSAVVKDLYKNASSAAPVTESGASDRDF